MSPSESQREGGRRVQLVVVICDVDVKIWRVEIAARNGRLTGKRETWLGRERSPAPRRRPVAIIDPTTLSSDSTMIAPTTRLAA